jgi:hypothetical protein
MTEKKKHNRKLGLSMVSLTKARPPRHDIDVATAVKNELEAVLLSSGYLDDAPFKWVTIVLRYGLKNEEKPHYQVINKKYGDLPLAIELDTHELIKADWDELKRLFTLAALKALIHAGKKHKLPIDELEERKEQISTQV